MIRTGETVVVPIGFSLIRCGISEPVTKTARSSTFWLRFEAWLTGGSASTAPASMLAAMRVAALEEIIVFTNNTTSARPLYANYRNDGDWKRSVKVKEESFCLFGSCTKIRA